MTTNVPTRLLVIQRLQAQLETITPANGYPFDLTGKVFRGRILLGADIKPLPAVSMIEASRPDAATQFTGDWSEIRREGWTILIQGLTEEDMLNPTDNAYHLEAAVEKCLAKILEVDRKGDPVDPVLFNLGGLITSLEIAPPVVRPPEDKVSSTGFFFLPIRVGLVGNLNQPYTAV